MASPNQQYNQGFIQQLFRMGMIIGVWLPIVLITLFHYLTSHEHHHIHDVLRRVYYIPIVISAISLGIRGGLIVAGTITLAYLPHAFFLLHHFDPARETEKILEILLYFAVGGIAGYLSDKERKQRLRLEHSLEEQAQLSDQLVRSGRLGALGETVAGIAHEVKNPLHAMAGTTEIIDPLIPETAPERKMWEIHKAEITRLGKVADRFLSFARPAEASMEPLDLRDVATRIVELARAQASQQGTTLAEQIATEPVPVVGDRDQLAQIGMNIVLNALKMVPQDTGGMRITVAIIERDGRSMAAMAIENDGPPIADDQLESIFDPFHSNTDSTGLGMSISSRIAAAHDGHITAANTGLGVTFTLWLPLAG